MGALSSLEAMSLFELCSVIFKTTFVFYLNKNRMEEQSSIEKQKKGQAVISNQHSLVVFDPLK